MNHRPRLAIVVSHPTQYYSPWFRFLSETTPLEIKVFYLWDFGVRETVDPRFNVKFKWDLDLLSGYNSEIVPNVALVPGAESFRGFNNPALPGRLSAWSPSVILLFGYNWLTHLKVIAWARFHSIPLIFRGDSHLIGRPVPSGFKRFSLWTIFSQFAVITYVGEANRSYFEQLGVAPDKLFFAPHAVDGNLYKANNPTILEGARAFRRQLGIAESTTVIMFAGKFVPDKQPMELLEAFLALALPDAALVFVGAGEMAEALRARATAGNVYFPAFANQSEMPARYAAADIFVLPSRGIYETWGLAVNEAMQVGTPCLVSDRVGCQRDLVTEGVTGWVFRSDDLVELRRKLREAVAVIARPAERAALRARVLERVAGYSYAAAAAGLVRAVTAAVGEEIP